MKHIYETAVMSIVLCEEEDILTLSNKGEVDITNIGGISWADLIGGEEI